LRFSGQKLKSAGILPTVVKDPRHPQWRDKSRSKVPVPLKLKSWDVVFSGITNVLCLCHCGVFAIFAKGLPATFLADEKSEELALFPHRIET
jgi:hypothetical protein